MNKEYQVLFFTHTGAIKFSRMMQKKNISCELMPVPRSLSSNCGVSARIFFDGQLEYLIDDHIEKIYHIERGSYNIVYAADE